LKNIWVTEKNERRVLGGAVGKKKNWTGRRTHTQAKEKKNEKINAQGSRKSKSQIRWRVGELRVTCQRRPRQGAGALVTEGTGTTH